MSRAGKHGGAAGTAVLYRPEKISLVVFAASASLLALAMAHCIVLRVPDLRDIVLPALSFSLLLVVAELFVHRLGRFLVAMVLHVAAVFVVMVRVGFAHPLIGVLLSSSLILNISLRLPIKISTPVNATLVLVPAAVAVHGGRTLLEVAIPVAVEATLICLCDVVAFYREALVSRSRKLEEEDRSVRNLLAANESFVRRLPEMKEESAEKERLRITRELHDSLGYSMTSIAMIMNAAQYLFEENPRKVREYCRKAKDMALETMAETRQTLYRLRAIARETPRQPAVFFKRMCMDFQEATGIDTQCHPGNLTRALPERVFQALFRTVQVGFINALKHGKASSINLFFWLGPDGLTMTIRNSIENIDFDMDQLTEGIGLKGVRERIETLEGDMRMARAPDAFTLTVTVPEKEVHDGEHLEYSG